MTEHTDAAPGRSPGIGEYAFLSDCHTAALVAPDGALEWMCVPRFDGPSVFARILDRDRGGAWELDVAGARPVERDYSGDSLVLRTRWEGPEGSAVGYDFLALEIAEDGMRPDKVLVRIVECEQGRVRLRSRVDARPDHGRRAASWTGEGDGLAADGDLLLSGVPAPTRGEDGTSRFQTELGEGESAVLALDYSGRVAHVDPESARARLERTLDAWRTWSARSDYGGVGAAQVRRSALVLRGLLFDESGGMLAAPTTSLPEWIGGSRNWDYRYVWHRDAALIVLSLLRLGHAAAAGRYLRFLLNECAQCEDRLAPVQAIEGGPPPKERVLDHLDGYAGSRPVRYGNEALSQHQLDVYGHVLDAALSYQEVTGELTEADLTGLWHVVELARRHWREPDDGIWEVRGDPRHWTNSKVYAWVCFDRAVRLAELTRTEEEVPVREWRRERDAVREEVLEHGYDSELGTFTQSYGSKNTDGSLLRIPLLGFLNCRDPRVLGTIERVDAELGEAGDLVHRYDPRATDDGMDDPEGAFLLCSFEMVSALVLAGRAEEARRRFDALCERAGPLGLFSEEIRADGTMLGNFPQAFTHLALIEAAMNLHEARDEDALHAWAERRARSERARNGEH